MNTFVEQIELKLMLSSHVGLSFRIGVFSNWMAKGGEMVLSACQNQRAGSSERICISHRDEIELVSRERPSSCDRPGRRSAVWCWVWWFPPLYS